MATKGNQSSDALTKEIEKARLGQAEKAAIRRARKASRNAAHQSNSIHTDKPACISGDEPLHALFSRVRKIIKGNHITNSPGDIISKSSELRRAVSSHGFRKAFERIEDAAIKSGMSGENAFALAKHSTSKFA